MNEGEGAIRVVWEYKRHRWSKYNIALLGLILRVATLINSLFVLCTFVRMQCLSGHIQSIMVRNSQQYITIYCPSKTMNHVITSITLCK